MEINCYYIKTNENMTKQEMLASVEAQIRKDIPRLMELREGCWFINFNGNKHKSLGWYINKENNRIHYSIKDEYMTYQTEEQMSKIEIIGHDIMLNDVLEWLILNEISIIPQCSKSESIMMLFYAEYDEWDNFYHYNTPWDLSSPCLKDQSEELIKFLYNIAKDE